MFKRIQAMFDEGHEIVGWIGMFLILAAYASVSLEFGAENFIAYQLMNLFGAGALLYSAAKTKSYPVAALNIAWIAIAFASLYILFGN